MTTYSWLYALARSVALLGSPFVATSSNAASCAQQIGRARAEPFVKVCFYVSPATRPPCNVANPCAMIRDEIARGCKLLGKDASHTPGC